MLIKILMAMVLVSIIVPMVWFYKSGKKNGKQCLIMNIIGFASFLGLSMLAIIGGGISAYADVENTAAAAAASTGDGLKFIGAALATGLSGIGGGVAVSSAASAAIGAMSENEQIMGKTLIFVALAEGIALYGLIISFLILFS